MEKQKKVKGILRKARMKDAERIQFLINEYAKQGLMLPRSINSIYEHIRDFWVYEESGKILGVCALTIFWNDLAEVRSLAVDPKHLKRGIGTALVKKTLEEAKEFGIGRVFTLTYQVRFFEKLGFKVIDKNSLPHKIWRDCINCVKFPNCDETAMEIEILKGEREQ
ncbi:GCN5-related N-acetyltransferase [Desulfurobacterium thermolithotrophum DSM 11699]|uniref:GCN5-related N-acetyltransferase n=1 Tax=Desulfurobacterium thermolithotrophum (strain DSM 11699 / BSA) TaxID=868864 RepID=F0S3M5_DESTD|nr:N-acetyltransferase [Desulfurobacterium thermolithotrophum]ADY73447.1 GCN5-related N-acetyltransferase [Desulfurobacterium thermolithotrophum DSM 11699]